LPISQFCRWNSVLVDTNNFPFVLLSPLPEAPPPPLPGLSHPLVSYLNVRFDSDYVNSIIKASVRLMQHSASESSANIDDL